MLNYTTIAPSVKIQTVDNYTESAIQAVQQINKGKGGSEMERDFLEK